MANAAGKCYKFTMMIRTIPGWLFHWFLQGMKMLFFLFIPMIVMSFICGGGAVLVDVIEQKMNAETQLVKISVIAIQIFTLCIAIALSAYYFADQLENHPFKKYRPKNKRLKS